MAATLDFKNQQDRIDLGEGSIFVHIVADAYCAGFDRGVLQGLATIMTDEPLGEPEAAGTPAQKLTARQNNAGISVNGPDRRILKALTASASQVEGILTRTTNVGQPFKCRPLKLQNDA